MTPTPLGRLNLIPWGLLDFFGIKSFGRNPQTLQPDLQGVVDLWQLYAETNSTIITSSAPSQVTANTAAGAIEITATSPIDLVAGAGALIVPNDEVWFIANASITWNLDATAVPGEASFGIRQTNENEVVLWPLVSMGFTLGSTAILRGGSAQLQRPRFLRPGTRISINCFGVTGALVADPVLFTLGLQLVRMQS